MIAIFVYIDLEARLILEVSSYQIGDCFLASFLLVVCTAVAKCHSAHVQVATPIKTGTTNDKLILILLD